MIAMKMRRVIAVTLLVLSFTPSPSQAFFNNDCKNLAKRTVSNQGKYEKQWNQYQNALANWLNAGGKFGSEAPVLNRLQQVGNTQLTILNDFMKYTKCLSTTNPSHWFGMRQDVSNAMKNATWISIQYSRIFPSVIDYTKYIKK